MSITPLSTPPSRDDPENFRTRADTFFGELPTFVTEANALAVEMDANAAAVAADAATAAAAIASVSATANATEWVSGSSYTTGDCVYSPLDFNTYRAKQATSGTTDPSLDTTNWKQISSDLTDSPTITNPTLEGATMAGGFTETVSSLSGTEIDVTAANYFYKTISGTTTFTLANVPATGKLVEFMLELTNGGSAVINWWSGIKWPFNTQPPLSTSGVDVIGFYSRDGGTTWRVSVLPSYDS